MSNKTHFNPDFIGVGFPRCATTWIFENLKKHPKICVSDIKETKFFIDIYNNKQDLKKYKNYFSSCASGKIKGEFTPGYINNKSSLLNIQESCPDSKLIISLRDPLEREISGYMNRFRHDTINKKDIESFFSREFDSKTDFYYPKLKFLFNIFDRDQIHIILFKDIKNNPKEVLTNLFDFLEIDKEVDLGGVDKKRNQAKKFILPSIQGLMSELYIYSKKNYFFYKILKHVGIYKLGKYVRDLNKNNVKKPKISLQVKEDFYAALQEDINNVEKLTGEDLSHWST